MTLPFTIEQFLDIFAQYNSAVWPAQIAAYMLGIFAVILAMTRHVRGSGRIVFSVLGALWLWNGFMYHIVFFSRINKAAFLFGGLFIVQGLLFLYEGVVRNRIEFRAGLGVYSITGVIFIAYAMLIYPAIGFFLGHGYPHAPMFGIAPCPTTIFTFGMLLLAQGRIHIHLTIIPFLWTLVGTSAALNLGITEDIGLLAAGVAGLWMIVARNRSVNNPYDHMIARVIHNK